jgi:hypothetical protein
MPSQPKNPNAEATGKTAAEQLDAINLQIRRKSDPRRLIEATIEEKAKKRRRADRDAASRWK